MDLVRGDTAPWYPGSLYRGRDPVCSCGAVHGRGGSAPAPIGGKEALFQHLKSPDAVGVVGISLRVHRVPRRVCSPQCCGLQPSLRFVVFSGKSGDARRTRHAGMECPRLLESDLLEPLCGVGTLHHEFDGSECGHCPRSIPYGQHL